MPPSSSSRWWYARNQSLLADDALKCVSRDANPRKSRLLIARVIGFRDVLLSFFFRLSFFRTQGFSSTVLTSLPIDSEIVNDLIRMGSYRSCSVVIAFVRISADRVRRSNCTVSLDRRRQRRKWEKWQFGKNYSNELHKFSSLISRSNKRDATNRSSIGWVLIKILFL